jgi:hypothetical protein
LNMSPTASERLRTGRWRKSFYGEIDHRPGEMAMGSGLIANRLLASIRVLIFGRLEA